MALIMCAQRLWTALNHARRPVVEVEHPLVKGTRLGDWAATVARFRRRDLVLALNVPTYLTLVFPLAPRHRFRSNFADALAQLLDDRSVPRDLAVRECAEIEVSRFEHLSSAELRAALQTVEFMCGVEMDYHEDLRRVQWNLNQFPHRKEEPSVPSDALAALFAPAPVVPTSVPGRGGGHARG